jgi:hypothetical protein
LLARIVAASMIVTGPAGAVAGLRRVPTTVTVSSDAGAGDCPVTTVGPAAASAVASVRQRAGERGRGVGSIFNIAMIV